MDESETKRNEQQRVARLAFSGVIVLLAVIFVIRNVDRYEDLNTEVRYSALIDMVEPLQATIETMLLSGAVDDIALLDSGEAGLPDEVLVTDVAHGISITDGRIIATWMKDESDLDSVTYIRTPRMEDGEIDWATTGTCEGKKAC
ncbi:MAG: hypothetical protein CBD02_02035 [Candidatus Pelagibacter sp. TMED142]|nr:MAG: hypothetical protein CBD02_02035 [Candidatus Pelagibacter sp. TMED142]